MVEATAPTRRRRLGAHGMMFRRRRIFARLREGFTYEEIASEEAARSMRSCNSSVSRPSCNSPPKRSPPGTSRR